MLTLLAVTDPSPTLTAVLDGWSAFERAACLTWLDEPTLQRATLEDVLLSSFIGALEAAARHEPQIQAVLTILSPPGTSDAPVGHRFEGPRGRER